MAGTREWYAEIQRIKNSMRGFVRRGHVTVEAVDTTTATVDGYLNGDTTTLISGIPYSGSVYPPNPGETWAVHNVEGDHILIHRLAAGAGTQPSPPAPPSDVLAPPGFEATFSYPGPIPATSPLSGPWPFLVPAGATKLTLSASLGTVDGTGHTLTVGYYLNGEEITTVVIPEGEQLAWAEIQVNSYGEVGDLLQVGIDTYTGSTAADLVMRVVGTP